MIHLDKALARIREYERMKLKDEFSTAGAAGSDAANAGHPSAKPAEPCKGTQSRTPVQTSSSQCLTLTHLILMNIFFCEQGAKLVMCTVLRLTPSS